MRNSFMLSRADSSKPSAALRWAQVSPKPASPGAPLL